MSFSGYLELTFRENSLKTEHLKNLNILTEAYLSPKQPPDPETIWALENLHSNGSEYYKTISRLTGYLERDLSLFINEKVNQEPIYFSQFLTEMIPDPNNRKQVRDLLIYPLILTMAFSYPPPVARSNSPPENETEGQSDFNVSYILSKLYGDKYEILPYCLDTSASIEEREQEDLNIFKDLLNRFVSMVDNIVSYLPSADDNTKNEEALCKNVYNKIVKPITEELLLPAYAPLFAKFVIGTLLEKAIEQDLDISYLRIIQFWCKLLLINLDPETSTEDDERMEQMLKSDSNPTVVDFNCTFGEKPGFLGLQPNGKFNCDWLVLKTHFGSPSAESVAANTQDTEKYCMQVTVLPIKVEKGIFDSFEPGFGVQLANEEIDGDVTLDLKKGWTTTDILKYDTFLKIQQRALSYLIGSSELSFNHMIFMFLHHGILHIGHLEIDLESLEFKDDPNYAGAKKVSLKLIKIKRRKVSGAKTNTNEEDSNHKYEEITGMAVPVKFKAYPLETVTGKTKVQLLSGMVALIVLVYKITQKMKVFKETSEIKIKMMALSTALRKKHNLSNLDIEDLTIHERENDEELIETEAETETEKISHGSNDENSPQRKKAKIVESGIL